MDEDTPAQSGSWVEYAGERDMERFWSEITPQREPMNKRWFLPVVIVLVLASVPWYLPAGFVGRLIGGLPIWIWTTMVCSFLIAGVTCYMALQEWGDDAD